MSDTTNMGNLQGAPAQEAANPSPANGGTSEASALPTPGIAVPPVTEAAPPDDRSQNARTPTPTGLRDFEGRRLYFANVCGTVSPHALHCIFRSYGPIRTFHYDTTLHYGYVVYMERQHALLARYGVDGLILGSRAIRVYYPPFKPRHPTRYCYNCREMGHFIQSCPYTHCNNWEYNYSPMYNQGQPVIDHMNHPSAPMMQHFPGHVIPPTSQFMFPTTPVTTIPGQPAGSATMMYQPGWPGAQPTATNMPFMPPFMGPVQPPMNSVHPPMVPMPPMPPMQSMPSHMNPAMPHPMHFNPQLVNQMPNPMQQPLIQPQTNIQQPQPINTVPPMIPVNAAMPPPQVNPMQPIINTNTVQPSASSMTPGIMQPPPPPPPFPYQQHQPSLAQMHPNINALIQEQATAIIQQHITPMVQQVVSQIMQDPAINNLQHSMMQHQNMDPSTLRSSSYTVNEEPESASMQSGSMTMQHGSYTAMEEPRNNNVPQNLLAQLMQNLPMQDSDSEFVDLGKIMQFAAQTLLQDQRSEDACSRSRCVHEMEEDVSPRQQNQRPSSVNCCPVHNTPLTRVQKPANTTAQQSTVTTTTTIHNGSTTTPRPQQSAEHLPPADQEFHTRGTSSTESIHPNTAEQPMHSADNQFYTQYPCQPPFSLPSSIFFTLPPIVVNITSPASYMSPTGSTAPEPKSNYPPPYDTLHKNLSENYDFMQENERNLREFEEVVRDDEQNFADNERDLRAQQNTMIITNLTPGGSAQPDVQPSGAPVPTPSGSKIQLGKRTMKIVRGKEQTPNGTEASIMVYEQSPQMSEREKKRQDRLKLRAMLTEKNTQDAGENDSALTPVNLEEESPGNQKLIYSELISTMNTSCSEIENLFTNLSSLVGNPLAKKCLDQIRTKSEADILKLSQQLLHKIVDKDKPSDKEEILKLSNDLLMYANQKLPSTSADTSCEGAVGGLRNADDAIESSRSECDSRKDDSDDGNYRRKNHWKKNKKRRR